MPKKIILYQKTFLIIIAVVAILAGCSTDKNAFLNRGYHNMTAKYNGYFNAGEIINEAMNEFAISRKEDYSKIIPVYEYPDNIESKALYPPMDTAAKKCESVISRHSMPAEKKGQNRKTEWCKWIDDNWLLIGQSQFYKRNFSDAMKNFKYVEKQYSNEPIVYSAMLWQAKTYIELGVYESAQEILDDLVNGAADYKEQVEKIEADQEKAKEKAKSKKSSRNSRNRNNSKSNSGSSEMDQLPPQYPKDLDKMVAPVYADLFLRQEKYPEAIEKLEIAIDLEKKHRFKTRLVFILAQVNHQMGNQRASKLYDQVVKMNPEYDMAFQAKINRALAFSGADNKGIKAQLLKMLKDDKNVDYLDQIYFALADIELRNNNKPEGIEYLELSVANSKANNEQKSKSFLRLGKLYYEERNYLKAQQYYDSTMAVLPKTHPEFETIEAKNVSLSELVKNLNIIEKQDSLLQLCNLSEKDLAAKIEDIILTKKEDDERKKEEQNNAFAISPFSNGNTAQVNNGGVFWVWDNNLKGSGFNDFKKYWGNRKLEDNWRRKDKTSNSLEEITDGTQGENEEYTIDYYLKDLPCGNDQKIGDLKTSIVDALYDVGNIYKNKLEDQEASKDPFIKLVNNYLPESKAIAALYQLYLMSNDASKSNYKNKILNDFPNSEYAKLIRDPNFKQNEQLGKEQEAKLYEKTLAQYTSKNYSAVIAACNNVINNDTANSFVCRYYYLKSLAIAGKNGGADATGELESSLEDVVNHCQGDPVFDVAQGALNKLRNIESINNEEQKYQYNSGLMHYFVVVVPNGEGNTNEIKSSISDFNSASFTSLNLKTSNTFLNSDTQLILVKSFVNQQAADDYLVAFSVNTNQVKEISNKYTFFIISNKNYGSLYADKNIPDYLEFFEKYYKE